MIAPRVRAALCAYVEFALDRIDRAGPQTESALRAEAVALRDAAEALERRAAHRMVIDLTASPDQAAFAAGRPVL
jgi:hypothetical protein